MSSIERDAMCSTSSLSVLLSGDGTIKERAVRSSSISSQSRSAAGSLRGAARVMEKEKLSSYILTNLERALPRVKISCSFIVVMYKPIVLVFAVLDRPIEVDASDLGRMSEINTRLLTSLVHRTKPKQFFWE